jgi:hypothetical protein
MSKAKSRLRPDGWLTKRLRRISRQKGAVNRRIIAERTEGDYEICYHATKGYRKVAMHNHNSRAQA